MRSNPRRWQQAKGFARRWQPGSVPIALDAAPDSLAQEEDGHAEKPALGRADHAPYRLAVTTSKETSKEAAAAVAAGMVLASLHPNETAELKSLMDAYLAAIPPGIAKSEGIKVGQEVAAKIVAE